MVSYQIVCISRTAYYYKPKLSDYGEIIDVLNKLTDKHNCWRFPKCFKRIRKLGYLWSHKQVHRVYTALNLDLRRKFKEIATSTSSSAVKCTKYIRPYMVKGFHERQVT